VGAEGEGPVNETGGVSCFLLDPLEQDEDKRTESERSNEVAMGLYFTLVPFEYLIKDMLLLICYVGYC